MRIRATVAAATGALALSTFAVPAAHAVDAPSADALVQSVQSNTVKPADDGQGDTKISSVVVNGGKAVVLGTTTKKTYTVTFTATDNSGIQMALAVLYHGANIEDSDNGAVPNEGEQASCTAVNSTTAKCKETFTVRADRDLLNANAGTWKVWAIAQGNDNDYIQKDNAKSFYVQRASKLTVNASPEPVKKGKTITVTGALTRANWESGKYAGYVGQPVKLQFKKKGATAYTTVKTVKTTSGGALKTTVKASVDGSYRYAFAGTTTTPAINAVGDFVDVK
jgi:hypothetical protein